AFAGAKARDAQAGLRAALDEIARIDDRLDALGGDRRSRAREIDLLRFQIADIDDAATTAGEDEQLDDTIAVLADADELLGHDQLVAELEQQRAEAVTTAGQAAQRLRKARAAAAPRLASAVTEHLHELA